MNYREDFPQLNSRQQGQPSIYADFAATTPKPQAVITAIHDYYSSHVANPGRGTYTLAFRNEQSINDVRKTVLEFLTAPDEYQVIFTKNSTEAVNLVAHSLARLSTCTLISSSAEHHANFLPWLQLYQEQGFTRKLLPLTRLGEPDLRAITPLVNNETPNLLALTHASNVTGNYTDLSGIQAFRQQKDDNYVLLDATQSLPHMRANLTETPVDFLVASGHKMFGPEGIGILVVHERALNILTPLLLGGGIVSKVSEDSYTLLDTVSRFEAGTPNSAGIIGLGAALDYLISIGRDSISSLEGKLCEYMENMIVNYPAYSFLPRSQTHLPIFSLYHPKIHAHDIADFLDQKGIAVRAGYHCAEPLHRALKVPPTVRLSLSFLNTTDEIDTIFAILNECLQKFA